MPRKNRAIDLADHLFAQIEALEQADTPEKLENEVRRSRAVTDIAGRIIDNQRTILDAHRLQLEYSGENVRGKLPALLLTPAGRESADDDGPKH